jgi:hypothetical protein
VYHGGKPEVRRGLVETMDEAAVGIGKELGHMKYQVSMP